MVFFSFGVFIYMYVIFLSGKKWPTVMELVPLKNLIILILWNFEKMFVYGNQPEQLCIPNTVSAQKMQIKQVTPHLCRFTVKNNTPAINP